MAKDIILTENMDLNIVDGDFSIGNSDDSNIELILLSQKGHFKENPLLGVGFKLNLNGPIPQFKKKLEKDLTIQLEADNAQNIEVGYLNDNLIVKADYY